MRARRGLVAFVGPSLPSAEVRRIAPCTVLPPARQGDVWRALALRPRAIALVDGVFESVPSVWHHELLDALDAGVAVFGGGSMGALRAVELAPHGMVGVGRVFGWYRDGLLRGDDEVALLHAGPDLAHRPLTVPLVNVRRAAEVLLERGAFGSADVRALLRTASAIFYAERTWQGVLAAAAPRLRPAAARALRALLRAGPPDVKAEDARATVAAARDFLRGSVRLPAAPPRRRPSALVRHRKLRDGATRAGHALVSSGAIVDRLTRGPDAAARADDGRRRLLLAALGRALGVKPTAADRLAAGRALCAARGVPHRLLPGLLEEAGLDGADAARLLDDLAVERLLLDRATEAVADGPSPEEGLAVSARLSGAWASAAARLAAAGQGRGARNRR